MLSETIAYMYSSSTIAHNEGVLQNIHNIDLNEPFSYNNNTRYYGWYSKTRC